MEKKKGKIEELLIQNPHNWGSIERNDFVCLRVQIPKASGFYERVVQQANEIYPHLNIGGANSSEAREPSTVEIDNLSGIIAEEACRVVLKHMLGRDCLLSTESNTSKNQIDIKLKTERTIEVRSSCVRNGIVFAVLTKNKENDGQQYFDVIGPYTNGYKPGESYKDYYMRVLYHCDKKKFMETILGGDEIVLYITGGATQAMMKNPDYYQIKHLTPAGGQVQRESDYQVIPLGKSLDFREFIEVIKRENQFS